MKEHAYVHTVQAVNKGQTERERERKKKRVCVCKRKCCFLEKSFGFFSFFFFFLWWQDSALDVVVFLTLLFNCYYISLLTLLYFSFFFLCFVLFCMFTRSQDFSRVPTFQVDNTGEKRLVNRDPLKRHAHVLAIHRE